MSCNGICLRYRASNNYANGQKRCKICEQFITWNGLMCPCCRHKLRTRPRNPKLYEKLREKRAPIDELKGIKIFFYLYNSM
jgi:hypothetical protein